MATLEERIQNLTQDIRPTMGAGVMSDREAEMIMGNACLKLLKEINLCLVAFQTQ
jgi:hypothetical protein